MTKKLFALLALIAGIVSAPSNSWAATPAYPTNIVKNQFGEVSINTIIGGSNQIDCNFVVDATNVNGLGISSLKGAGCAAVYMHTSATPAVGNPNPAVGYILVKLAANYSGYVGGYSGFVSPLTGTPINISSGLTQHNAYVITSVGTSTAANWQAVGLPAGITPAIGASFVATTSSAGTGTGIVQAPAAAGAGALSFDMVGDANQSVSATGGAQLLLRVLKSAGTLTMNSYTPAGTNDSATPPIFTGTPAVLTGTIATSVAAVAPADNSVIALRFVMLPTASQLK